MPIAPAQLSQQLNKGLAPVYLLAGSEPLQLGEAADAIRTAARQRGFSEREVLETGADFDWSSLAGALGSLSLFAERRLIELRISAPKSGSKGDGVGREGSDAIRRCLEHLSADVLLLILAPGLDWKSLKTKWVQAVEQAGVLVQVREPQGRQLNQWLDGRLRRAGFIPSSDAVALLAERVEGNLLAADQEITKLGLALEPGPLDGEGLMAAVADSARYGVFDLADAALSGDRARVARVLEVLQAEGTAEPLVLWALAREVRKLAALSFARAKRQPLGPLLKAHQVWDSRRPLVMAALDRLPLEHLWELVIRCADADLAIKGRGAADPWHLFRRIAEGLAAAPS
ncbi:MAG: DNA polymerase III subunit delta [Halochromatium sp.]|nr:DNA polymerase III subunit delta [Halochromatium sp.]